MLTALIALGIFGTILLFLQACVVAHRMMKPRGADRAVERVQKWSSSAVTSTPLEIVRREILSEIPWLNDFLMSIQRLQVLRKLHQQSGCRAPVSIFVLGTPFVTLVALIVMFFLHATLVLSLLVAAGFGALPPAYLYWLKRNRLALFERQLPEALELVSRALRAGHAFSVGLKLVGEESAEPIGVEFKRVFDEVSMGVALPQALQNLTERIDSVDLRFFMTAVLVQRETGGNLAEIIDTLAALIRKRFELQLKVKALSAEGRISAVVLTALPLVLGAFLYKTNYEYMSLLFTDPLGQKFVTIGSVLMITGTIIMKRMVAIKV